MIRAVAASTEVAFSRSRADGLELVISSAWTAIDFVNGINFFFYATFIKHS
jgi:hypothetical protein